MLAVVVVVIIIEILSSYILLSSVLLNISHTLSCCLPAHIDKTHQMVLLVYLFPSGFEGGEKTTVMICVRVCITAN